MDGKLFKYLASIHGDDMQSVANILGVNKNTVYSWVNGKGNITQKHMRVIVERWSLSPEQIKDLFFPACNG